MNDRGLPAESDDGARPPDARGDGGRPVRTTEARAWQRAPARPEEEVGLDEIWAVLRRRWGWIAAAVVLALGAAAWWTWRQPAVWEAANTVRVEERSRDLSGAEETLLLGRRSGQLETEMRVLETRPIREEVVRRLDLALTVDEPAGLPRDRVLSWVATSPPGRKARYRLDRTGENRWRLTPLPADSAPDARRTVAAGDTVRLEGASFVVAPDSELREGDGAPPERVVLKQRPVSAAVAALGEGMSVRRPDPDARLLQVRYRGTDRRLVPEVANTLTDAFLDRRQRVQSSEARSTVAFLEEQTARIETQLEAAEEKLQRFREREQVVAPEAEAEAQVQQRAELEARRAELASEREALARLVEELEAEESPRVERLATFPTFLGNETVQNLFESLVEARQQKTDMLEDRTEKHPDVVALTNRIERLERQLADVGRNYLESLDRQIAALDDRLARFGSELKEVPGREVQFARLQRRTELLGELHTTLQQRLKEAEVREAVEDPSIRVVETAVLPDEPVSPRPVRNLAFAGFLGLMLGVGLAFVREYTDRRIRSDEDLDRLLGTPVLSRIPQVPEAGDAFPRPRGLIVARDGRSRAAEAYRTLRTNVRYARAGEGARELAITSPGPRDGKSITASNLAVAFAQQGRRTLLVDADLRKSVQHEAFELAPTPGLSDWLVEGGELAPIVRLTEVENLSVVPAGTSVPNPAELLGSDRMETFLERVREQFDALVVDTPPALLVTDSSVLAPRLEGVIVVVRADQTNREAAVDALEQLRRVDCEVLGVVMNDTDAEGRYAYGYEYSDYYGEAPRQKGRLRRMLPFGG